LDFITKTLDTVLSNNYLAVKYNKGNADAGRATLGAALMLKAYMQLVAASPLHNSATYPGGADPNKLVTFGNYDVNRWATRQERQLRLVKIVWLSDERTS
jgi:hypothetical protein